MLSHTNSSSSNNNNKCTEKQEVEGEREERRELCKKISNILMKFQSVRERDERKGRGKDTPRLKKEAEPRKETGRRRTTTTTTHTNATNERRRAISKQFSENFHVRWWWTLIDSRGNGTGIMNRQKGGGGGPGEELKYK